MFPREHERKKQMLFKRKIIKTAAALLSAAFIGLFGTAGYYSSQLPDVITADTNSFISLFSLYDIKSPEIYETTLPI